MTNILSLSIFENHKKFVLVFENIGTHTISLGKIGDNEIFIVISSEIYYPIEIF